MEKPKKEYRLMVVGINVVIVQYGKVQRKIRQTTTATSATIKA